MGSSDDNPQSQAEAKAGQRASIARDLAAELGFGLVGIAPAQASAYREYFEQWLGQDKHGEMAYLANHADIRVDPGKLLPGAASVIVVADAYPDTHPVSAAGSAHSEAKPQASQQSPLPRGRIARYAWGDDYHNVIKKRLHRLADALGEAMPSEQFRSTVDTAPLFEREHATRAGLGWVGKHTLLIHPRHGSWLLLGTIVTTANLASSQQQSYPPPTVEPTDHCGTCTRCIDACPTDCITPYQLDASRCISYLTLEHRGPIDASLHKPMGDWLAGCDVCQEVCPHNQSPNRLPLPTHEKYTPRPPSPSLDLLEVLSWSPEDRQAAFTRSALKRIKLDMLYRNALIAAGNALADNNLPPDQRQLLHKRVEQLAVDEAQPELVRTTASQVLASLAN